MVNGGPDEETTTAALAAFGLQIEEPIRPSEFEVWPDNWQPLRVFSRMTSQLIVGGMGGVLGLRYEALPVVMRGLGLPAADRAEVFDVFQIMEQHMVHVLNKRAN